MNTAAHEFAPPKAPTGTVPAMNRAEPESAARAWGAVREVAHSGGAVRFQVPRAAAPVWGAVPDHHAEPLTWAMTATIGLYGAVLAAIGVLIYTSV